MKVIAILAFGVVGIFFRYSLELFAIKASLATLAVNMLGCLLAGFIYASDKFNQEWTTILLVGLCGGLTTFSGHIVQSLKLIESGNFLQSSIYLIVPLLLGLCMLLLGVKVARVIV